MVLSGFPGLKMEASSPTMDRGGAAGTSTLLTLFWKCVGSPPPPPPPPSPPPTITPPEILPQVAVEEPGDQLHADGSTPRQAAWRGYRRPRVCTHARTQTRTHTRTKIRRLERCDGNTHAASDRPSASFPGVACKEAALLTETPTISLSLAHTHTHAHTHLPYCKKRLMISESNRVQSYRSLS